MYRFLIFKDFKLVLELFQQAIFLDGIQYLSRPH